MALFLRNRIAKALGVQVQEHKLRAVDDPHAEIIERCKPFTLVTSERLLGVVNAAEYVAAAGIPGAFVECGVYKAGCSMAAAWGFLGAGRSDIDLWLYDTYEGMPPASNEDVHIKSGKLAEQMFPTSGEAWDAASFEEVQANMARTGYPTARIHMIKGMVEDTIPAQAPDAISILRLDTDWYASTKHELEHLFPRLSRGGVLIIDDYGHWAGNRKAVDEYFAEHGIHMLLNRTDYAGRMGVKI